MSEEVDLWEVSLSTIVDAYIGEIERMESFDLEIATEFLLIAATLVELKSRRLLPGPAELELDEELLRFEERDLLLARLLEYKTFKDATDALVALIGRADRSLSRTIGPEEPFRSLVPDPLERVRPTALRDAARRALRPHTTETVDTDHIAARAGVTFRDLVEDAGTRLDVVVRFLAVLELFKQGIVDLEQTTTFGTLSIRRLIEGEAALDALSLADWDDGPRVPPARTVEERP